MWVCWHLCSTQINYFLFLITYLLPNETLMLWIPHAVTTGKRMRGTRLSSLVDGFLVSSLFLMTECGRRMWAPESSHYLLERMLSQQVGLYDFYIGGNRKLSRCSCDSWLIDQLEVAILTLTKPRSLDCSYLLWPFRLHHYLILYLFKKGSWR